MFGVFLFNCKTSWSILILLSIFFSAKRVVSHKQQSPHLHQLSKTVPLSPPTPSIHLNWVLCKFSGYIARLKWKLWPTHHEFPHSSLCWQPCKIKYKWILMFADSKHKSHLNRYQAYTYWIGVVWGSYSRYCRKTREVPRKYFLKNKSWEDSYPSLSTLCYYWSAEMLVPALHLGTRLPICGTAAPRQSTSLLGLIFCIYW